jgi:hypothetical protein
MAKNRLTAFLALDIGVNAPYIPATKANKGPRKWKKSSEMTIAL